MSSEQRTEKQDTTAFFTGSALLPRIFSCLPRSSRLLLSLSLSPSVCSLRPSACLSHSTAAVFILYSVLFLNEAFFSCIQPVSFTEAQPQLADCGCTVAILVDRDRDWSWHLKEKRGMEKQRCDRNKHTVAH